MTTPSERRPRREGDIVRFAFAGDSRQGVGGGAKAFMGVDALILERELHEAWNKGAAFWIQGGDLVNGYTTEVDDFRAQFRAFKWAASSFLHERPIYAGVGNHDAAIRSFEKGRPRTAPTRRSFWIGGLTRARVQRRSSPTSSSIPRTAPA